MIPREFKSHLYRKVALMNDRRVDILLDTGSHFTLVKECVAIRCGLSIKVVERPLYGLGSTTVPSTRTIGEPNAEIWVDGMCPGAQQVLIVSDVVQGPDVIVGRMWLDMPTVSYHKTGGQLYIYQAEPNVGETEITAVTLDSEADYLHTVEVSADLPKRRPLTKEDLGLMSPNLTNIECNDLLNLINRYRSCFALDLSELGCTPLMTVDINELPGSRLVVCRPCKTMAADREEIAKIVSD